MEQILDGPRSLLEPVRRHVDADENRAVRERDEPPPAVGCRNDNDVAARRSFRTMERVEVSERRAAIEKWIAIAPANLLGQQGVAAGRVDHHLRRYLARR